MPKRIQPLTDAQVKATKPRDDEFKLSDGLGLHLLVTSSGGKLWRFQYRFAGKQKLLAFGAYPAVSLSDARKRRDAAKELLANGDDPGAVKKAQKAAALAEANNTFEAVALEWYGEKKADWTDHHAKHVMRRMEVHVFPFIGDKPITEIETKDLVAILRRVSGQTLETAHRLKTIFYQVFRYASQNGKIKQNPATDFRDAIRAKNPKGMAAPTDPKDVAPLLRAIDGFQGSFIVRCALKLAPLFFCRPGELRHAEWAEIDLEAATWSIPAEKMKMRQPHIVPLSTQALEILKELKTFTGTSKYVFPSARSFSRCMSDNAINAALRRMGFDKEEITGHGFRAMARTILDEVLQVRPDFIEHQLAHMVRDPNGRAYNRTAHLAERHKMMQLWSDYLDGLKTGAKVLPFKTQIA